MIVQQRLRVLPLRSFSTHVSSLHASPFSAFRLQHLSTVTTSHHQIQRRLINTPRRTNKDLYENIYTIPNLLTLSRIASCPFLGYYIIHGNMVPATILLAYAGATDLLDGWLARKYNMGTVMGSVLDPAADKALMTTLTVTLAINGLLPVPLAALILGRDVALSFSAFYWRYKTIPEPKTFVRFWDFSIPSAEVKPTTISKYNTFLQLVLMGTTTISPLLPIDIAVGLTAMQWTVAGTTIWSGLSYLSGSGAVDLTKAQK